MDHSITRPENGGPADAHQPTGDVIGRYRLSRLLGQGGMGRVWQARDELLGRDVAIKELAPEGLASAELGDLRERAIREARAVAQINHPNIIRIFDVVEHVGTPWIVMELIQGRSLYDLVHDEGPMDPGRAASIGLDILGALRAAHQAGVLHRDVKPANVLIGGNGRVVLTDFGVAVSIGDSRMTLTGVMLGSPSYMAPERALDQPATEGSDLWSLGATLFAAVEGRPPYERSSPMATLAALMVNPPPVPKNAGVIAPALEALLQRDPALRADAERAAQLLGGLGRPSREVPRRHRRAAIVVAGVVAAVTMSIAAIAVDRNANEAPMPPARVLDPGAEVRSPSGIPSARESSIPSAPGSSMPRRTRSVPATVTPSRSTSAVTVKTSTPTPPVTPALRVTFEAESFTDNHGTEYSFPSEGSGGKVVGKTDTGDWVGYRNRPLAGVRYVVLRYSAGAGDTGIELRSDSATGRLLGTVTFRRTATFQTFATVSVELKAPASGPLFVTFLGPKGSDIDTVTYVS